MFRTENGVTRCLWCPPDKPTATTVTNPRLLAAWKNSHAETHRAVKR